ncbi:MAG: NADH:flavin oxidoreductase [Gammaproteobacteria bacterium]|jgi:2,4-dienoyl-CoA reductase-like NADH-dependent reductase (Old Yellow Enzyme family)|nr:NADH:flavin oxidoreductase [Gammaproteobacteria bacterium]
MNSLSDSVSFIRGPAMKNRFMLAPLTNSQSHDDGSLSDEEFHWLTLRARGGFGLTMTCASHVQANGRGFPGQLGVFSDEHLAGLTRLASAIKAEGSVAVVQLHHAGMRAPRNLIEGPPVCPSDDVETGARALTLAEVEQLAEDFILAAIRAERAGFDGVELHSAHGYVICQFLSAEFNHRTDRYGGSLENRSRLLLDILDGIRARCRPDFMVGVRLSPERFGMQLAEVRQVAQRLMSSGLVDFLDLSLWDAFKEPDQEEFQGRSLLSWFTDLERGDVRIGAAGKITNAAEARRCVEAGADFAVIGRSAILHHDFPRRVAADPEFEPTALPVTRDYLRAEGLSRPFIAYMATWKGFVAD